MSRQLVARVGGAEAPESEAFGGSLTLSLPQPSWTGSPVQCRPFQRCAQCMHRASSSHGLPRPCPGLGGGPDGQLQSVGDSFACLAFLLKEPTLLRPLPLLSFCYLYKGQGVTPAANQTLSLAFHQVCLHTVYSPANRASGERGPSAKRSCHPQAEPGKLDPRDLSSGLWTCGMG